jgi:hypothetical protein
MKILGRTQSLSQYPILECLKVIKRLGFDALYNIGFKGGLALDLYDVDYEAVSPDAVTYLKRCLAKITTSA